MSQPLDPTPDTHETYPKKGTGGRGFFAVLMLCLIAVGGVAAATFSDHAADPPLASEPSATNATTLASTVTTTTAKPVAVTPATTTTVTTATETTPTTAPSSLFVLPLSNKVLTPFSEQPLYNETLDTYRAHTAIDFDGEEGQRVHPLANGTVTEVQTDALWGGCVTIDHGAGVVSVYRGIEPHVSVGEDLTTEDDIGILGAVPCESTLGPHLHLELYKDGNVADAAVLFEDRLVYE